MHPIQDRQAGPEGLAGGPVLHAEAHAAIGGLKLERAPGVAERHFLGAHRLAQLLVAEGDGGEDLVFIAGDLVDQGGGTGDADVGDELVLHFDVPERLVLGRQPHVHRHAVQHGRRGSVEDLQLDVGGVGDDGGIGVGGVVLREGQPHAGDGFGPVGDEPAERLGLDLGEHHQVVGRELLHRLGEADFDLGGRGFGHAFEFALGNIDDNASLAFEEATDDDADRGGLDAIDGQPV